MFHICGDLEGGAVSLWMTNVTRAAPTQLLLPVSGTITTSTNTCATYTTITSTAAREL